MAFADPIVTSLIGGAAKSLVRIDSGRFASEYRLVEATQEFKLLVRNTELKAEADGRKKVRHNISLLQTVFATSTTPEWVRSTGVTIQHYSGDDITLVDDIALAVAALVTVANVAKLANFES